MHAPHDDGDRVYTAVQAAARRKRAGILLRGVLGVPLLLVGPAVLASMFWAAAALGLHRLVPWTWLFLPLAIVMVPLLLRLEARTGGNYLIHAVRDSHPETAGWSAMPDPYFALAGMAAAARNPRGISAGFVEIFLTGPRLLVGAYRDARALRALAGVDPQQAAAVLAKLAGHGEGLTPGELFGPGDRPRVATATLAWLVLHDWIGVSAGGGRVYLYSEARQKLERPRA